MSIEAKMWETKTKTCSKCGNRKPATPEFFCRDRKRPDGLYIYCKVCTRKTNQSEKKKEWHKRRDLKRHYGMTLGEWNTLFEKQKGCCAICGIHQSETKSGHQLSVDHNHTTGEVRGLLCRECNTQLPLVEDAERLRSALEYLRGWL